MGPVGGAARRFVSWGEILWDLFPEGRRLGGAPANVAYHLAALGAEAALVSRVGDDEPGRAALAALAAAGVDVAAVQTDRARPTGAVGVELVAGEARYRFHPNCAWEHIEWDARASAAVTEASAICFGTLSQRLPTARAALETALSAARGPDAPATERPLAVCDLNLRPVDQNADLLRWSLAAADVVKLNQREEELLGQLFGQRDVVEWLCDDLGVAVVAVTRGSGGCRIIARADRAGRAAESGDNATDQNLIDRGPRAIDQAGWPAAPGGDTVGCGDAFTAVLALGLTVRSPLEQIARAACRYAGAVAGQRGATPLLPRALIVEIREALGLGHSPTDLSS